MMGYYWPMMGGWWGGGWGIGMMIIGAIVWIVIILGIIWLIRVMAGGGYHHMMNDKDSAIKILKERYAKGEIDKQEYEEKMRDLSK
jgi:putative membrane protein